MVEDSTGKFYNADAHHNFVLIQLDHFSFIVMEQLAEIGCETSTIVIVAECYVSVRKGFALVYLDVISIETGQISELFKGFNS